VVNDKDIEELNRITMREFQPEIDRFLRQRLLMDTFRPTGLPRLPTPSQWKRWQLRWWYPLRNYVATVGKALRGVELVEPQDFEDY